MYGEFINTNREFYIIEGDVNDVMLEMPQGSVSLVVADPPYNTSKAGGRKGFKGKSFMDEKWDIIENYGLFSRIWMENARNVMKDNATMYLWCYHRSIPHLPLLDWYPLNLMVWKKTNAFPSTMQNSMWPASCEYAWFLRKKAGKDHTFHIGKDDFPKERDTFTLPVVTNKRHPSEKPLAITKEFIRRSTNEGDLVLDLFSGSGTVLEACLQLNRRCVSVERSRAFIEVIKNRIASYLDEEIMTFDLPV